MADYPGKSQGEGDLVTETQMGVSCFEVGGRGPKPRIPGDESKETDSPFCAFRKNQPCGHLVFSSEKLILDFWSPEL